MAIKYKHNINPINDLFLNMIMDDVDVCDPENKRDIIEVCKGYFQYILPDENDFVYLQFDITSKNNIITITANNMVTALLFNGISPYGCDYIMKSNRFENNDGLYEFNKISKKLTLNGKEIKG